MVSDAIFAIVGTPPDEGHGKVSAAIALGKGVLFRDDFRHCTDCEEYPLNLMVFTGLPRRGWQDYYYSYVAEISGPTAPAWSGGNLTSIPDRKTSNAPEIAPHL